MTRAWLFALPLAFFALLAAVFLVQLRSGKQASEVESALIGQPAPVAVLPAVGARDTTGFSSAQLAMGRVSVVNFWATWCGPCKIEHPDLLALKARGIPVHGILYRDKAGAATDYLAEMGDPYVMLGDDPKGRTGIDFGVTGVPETFVVDGRGVILARIQGPLSPDIVKRQILPLTGVQN